MPCATPSTVRNSGADDDAQAKRFLATPHPELGGRKPIEAALTDLGARQVEDVVMRALYGLPV